MKRNGNDTDPNMVSGFFSIELENGKSMVSVDIDTMLL
jgi:hypothetical protein